MFFPRFDESTWSRIPWLWKKRERLKLVAYAESLNIQASAAAESARPYPRKPSYPGKQTLKAFFDFSALPSGPT
jgi:hypothetical protein